MKRAVIAAMLCSVALGACGDSKPSHTQALEHLEKQCFWRNPPEGKCITRVTRFDKTNGFEQDFMGVKSYVVTGVVRYAFEEDAIERTFLGEKRSATVAGKYEQVYKTEVLARKGATKEQEVQIMFLRTDNGWQPQNP